MLLPLLLSLIEYMQLGIIEDGFTKEIYPNVFEIHKTLLAEKYNSILEEPVADLSVITQLIDFVTLDPASLKTANGKHHDLLPVWEREKRDKSIGIDSTNYSVIPYMVTNKLFSSRYKKIEFPIITYYELQKLLGERI